MALEHTLLVWAHLIAASIWVGGSLFLGIVLAPVLKHMYDTPKERIRIMVAVGRRFNKIAVPSLLVLLATGIYNSRSLLENPALLDTPYGTILTVKVVLVVLLIAVFLVHVRMIRKDVEDGIMSDKIGDKKLASIRKRIIILGEVSVVLSVAVLFLAAALDTGL